VKRWFVPRDFFAPELTHPDAPLPFNEFHVSLLSALINGRLISTQCMVGFGCLASASIIVSIHSHATSIPCPVLNPPLAKAETGCSLWVASK
jgi:hypothetical protein